eukprot:1147772-Pelagomonas_calceolata.AAC.5
MDTCNAAARKHDKQQRQRRKGTATRGSRSQLVHETPVKSQPHVSRALTGLPPEAAVLSGADQGRALPAARHPHTPSLRQPAAPAALCAAPSAVPAAFSAASAVPAAAPAVRAAAAVPAASAVPAAVPTPPAAASAVPAAAMPAAAPAAPAAASAVPAAAAAAAAGPAAAYFSVPAAVPSVPPVGDIAVDSMAAARYRKAGE